MGLIGSGGAAAAVRGISVNDAPVDGISYMNELKNDETASHLSGGIIANILSIKSNLDCTHMKIAL
jgi:hypothetical protein